jgi:hypothetical protein
MTERAELAAWWQQQGDHELRLLLWAAWDPIEGVPRDEYDSYVGPIWSLLARRASEHDIAARLGEYRVERMGLPPAAEDDLRAARKLRDWLDPPGVFRLRPVDLL